MRDTICGVDCSECIFHDECSGCMDTCGKPFGKECLIAECCKMSGYEKCSQCLDKKCTLKERLIFEFNCLGIKDMEKVTDLNSLKGSFINLEYKLGNNKTVKLLDDDKIYLGNQIQKSGSDRCYGLTANNDYILVCEYGNDGSNPEIIVYKKRQF